MDTEALVYTSSDTTIATSPEPGMQRQVLAYNQNLMLVRHHFAKGWRGSSHSHPHEQLVYVVSGHMEFDADGRTLQLRAGDSVVVAGHVEHQARAIEDSDVLDVFTPYRSDYAG